MSWADFFKGTVKALGKAAVLFGESAAVVEWLKMEDRAALRYHIRSTIRGVTAESAKRLEDCVKWHVRDATVNGDMSKRSQAIIVHEILIEELANRSPL